MGEQPDEIEFTIVAEKDMEGNVFVYDKEGNSIFKPTIFEVPDTEKYGNLKGKGVSFDQIELDKALVLIREAILEYWSSVSE